jgi:hypothetical protein
MIPTDAAGPAAAPSSDSARFPVLPMCSAADVNISLTLREHHSETSSKGSKRHRKDQPMQNLEETIRERAYHLWIADGQPEGQADVYWLDAQREILTMSIEGSTAATAHMDSVSATTKPVKKAKAARSGKGKSRAA